LTLRHGNDNLVENNVFLGNRVDHTGGIRVINKRQTVRNNYLHGLTGHRFGGAFVIMNGVPNSPINRYHRVENAIIENNSIIESDHIELAAGSDEERSAPPVTTAFRNNLIYNEDGRNVIAVHDDVSGIEFRDNILNRVQQLKIANGFRSAEVELVKGTNGLLYPADSDFAKVGAKPGLRVLDKAETGVDWYPKPGSGDRFDTGATVPVSPGLDTLVDGVARAKSGDIVVLASGEYPVSRTIVVDKPVTVRGEGEVRITFERTALFEIVDGGSLKLVGVKISGAEAPDVAGNAAIRTSRYSMLNNYALVVEGSVVEDLDTNHSFNFFALAKHTFADRIEIRNSTFRNVTGSILALNREDDDLGIYNGEYIRIDNSEFRKIGGAIADIYRGGTDESTFGPHFTLRASTIGDVGKNKRNKSKASIRLHGVQATDIHDNVFVDSWPIRVTETVGEPVTRLSGNTFDETAEPEILQIGAGR
jgi:poly(beta-D-mannuronate) lyase